MAIKELKNWVMGSDVDEDNYEGASMDFATETAYEEPVANAFETTAEQHLGATTATTAQDFSNKSSQMVVFEPRSYSESQGIADHLKSGRGCIINLHRVSKEQAKRIIDFLSGVVYAIEGEVQKIGPNVFLCTPSNFGVYGEISETEE